MFTLEQITEVHDRLGKKNTLVDYLLALRELGVKEYDSYIADGHAEYYGTAGQRLTGPPSHETFTIAAECDREWFLRYVQQIGEGGVGYVEMSKTLADHGVEKWTFDTEKLTITYVDRKGDVLLCENVE